MIVQTENTHPRIPKEPSTTPYWRLQPSPLDDFRSSDTVPKIVDVAIIGSGFSGAATAYHLLTETPPKTAAPTIAIFEARQACSGATGRNGGHTKLAPRPIAGWATKYGPGVALNLAIFLKDQMHAIKACAESIMVPVDEHQSGGQSRTLAQEAEVLVTRSWDVFLDEEHAADIEREWSEAVRGMREIARRDGRERDLEWLDDVQFLKGPHVKNITSVREAKAVLSCPALSLWPYKLVMGLLQQVLNLGGKLYTHTPVTKIKRVSTAQSGLDPHSSTSETLTAIYTPRGITLARKVVFSTNAYASALLPQYEKTIIPYRGTACHIVRQPSGTSTLAEPEGAGPTSDYEQLVNTYNIHASPSSVEYFNPRPDGGLILGGGQELYRDDKSVWWDMIDDNSLIEGVKEHWFKGYMGRKFRGWDEDGRDEKVDCVWTGIQGYTEDNFPHVGLVPGETDHFIMAGFNGSGMASIFLVARGISQMARDDISFEETGLPSVFKTLPERMKATDS